MEYFSDKVVIVTGASAGIGLEFSRQLVGYGAKVLGIARRSDKLQELAHSLEGAPGCFEWRAVDLVDGEAVKQFAADIMARHDIDILINNAGRGSFGFFEERDIGAEVEMLRLNVEAPLVLASAVLPQLKKKGSGGIITLSSVAGLQPLPYMATYAATKAANLFHSWALYEELRPFGVHALAVCPGPVATEFLGVARVPGTPTAMGRDDPKHVVFESLRAFTAKKPVVYPGRNGLLMSLMVRALPRWVTTRGAARALKGAMG